MWRKMWIYNCMFNVYKNQPSRQTGSRNLTGPKTLPTIWHTYMKLVTKYQISAIDSCWEKISWTDGRMEGQTDRRKDGRTDRGKTVYPPPPPGSGGMQISDIARVLQQPRSTISDIIRRFKEAGTVENRMRSGRPHTMDYRQLEKIVKTERRALLVEITAKFNEERNVSVSKRTVRWRLMDHGFSRRVCRKKAVVKFDNRKKRLA